MLEYLDIQVQGKVIGSISAVTRETKTNCKLMFFHITQKHQTIAGVGLVNG